MRPLLVVRDKPALGQGADLGERFEEIRIEHLGAIGAIEALDEGVLRSGPRIVDSVLSEISTGFQAAVFTATCSKYTASGVRRSSAVCRRRVL